MRASRVWQFFSPSVSLFRPPVSGRADHLDNLQYRAIRVQGNPLNGFVALSKMIGKLLMSDTSTLRQSFIRNIQSQPFDATLNTPKKTQVFMLGFYIPFSYCCAARLGLAHLKQVRAAGALNFLQIG